MAVLQWAEWDAQSGDPPALCFVEFIAPAVNPDASPPDSGPYLQVARVADWGAVIAAHMKASDEHIHLQGSALLPWLATFWLHCSRSTCRWYGVFDHGLAL
jgi:hypothetical protein